MIKKNNWVCPTMCGCVIEETRDYRVSTAVKAKFPLQLAAIMIQKLEDEGQFDEVITTRTVIAQCAADAGKTPDDYRFVDASYAEGSHYIHTGNACVPMECGCKLAYCFDERLPNDKKVFTPVDHPIHTIKCACHDIVDAQEHFDKVMSDAKDVNDIRAQIALDAGVTIDEVPYEFGVDGLNIDSSMFDSKLSVSQKIIDDAIVKKASAQVKVYGKNT